MTRKKTEKKTVAAFVGMDGRGNLAWATIRETPQACLEIVERFNPPVEGVPPPLHVTPVQISYDPGKRLVVQRRLGFDQITEADFLVMTNSELRGAAE